MGTTTEPENLEKSPISARDRQGSKLKSIEILQGRLAAHPTQKNRSLESV
jgi:hypothetical protein